MGSMPRWVIICSKCTREFTHILIRELTHGRETRDVFASPPKPAMPEEGARLNCPHCGSISAYKTYDLRYRGD
jgi:DNA-directed RNA polymerase subunit RPC12/RpoP